MHNVKQTIVMQRGLNMRRGKEISQGGHGVASWMAKEMLASYQEKRPINLTQDQLLWLTEQFTKITLQVPNEKELFEVYQKARAAKLTVHMITDSGVTEFGGIPTKTCICIGPHDASLIDPICSSLKLY